MASIKIPTPLRAYTGQQSQVDVHGETIGEALADLIAKHPDLKPHLFNGDSLRSFVNVFLGEEDVRFLDGLDTPLEKGDSLRIIPSIAGGSSIERRVDQTGLKVGQAATIILLVAGFVLNLWPLVTLVAVAQLLNAVDSPYAPFRLLYQKVLRPRGIVQPNPQPDNPEPHRFAQSIGAGFNFAATLALIGGASTLGWALVWVVIALANVNFWANICVGCLMYYQLHKFGVPGFTRAPIA